MSKNVVAPYVLWGRRAGGRIIIVGCVCFVVACLAMSFARGGGVGEQSLRSVSNGAFEGIPLSPAEVKALGVRAGSVSLWGAILEDLNGDGAEVRRLLTQTQGIEIRLQVGNRDRLEYDIMYPRELDRNPTFGNCLNIIVSYWDMEERLWALEAVSRLQPSDPRRDQLTKRITFPLSDPLFVSKGVPRHFAYKLAALIYAGTKSGVLTKEQVRVWEQFYDKWHAGTVMPTWNTR